jgi:hypothetical protein
MSPSIKPYIQAAWLGFVVQIAGRVLDARWHATHDEFEGTSQQLEAHWLLWLGVAVTLVAAGLALTRLPRDDRPGFSLLFGFTGFYIAVAVWHFIAHANLNDPAVAHVFLALGQLGMIAATIWATLQARRVGPPPAAPGGDVSAARRS